MVIKGRLIQIAKKNRDIYTLRIEDFPFPIDFNPGSPEQKNTLIRHLFEEIECSVDRMGYCNCLVFNNDTASVMQ